MTPQEKAKELVDKYFIYASQDSTSRILPNAKTCAIIVADEFIETFKRYTGMYDQEFFDSELKYWQQVKTSIESL